MAEFVASIIGISGAALKLSTGLYKVASALRVAGQEVRIIANDTAQFSRALKELGHSLGADIPAIARARSVAEDVITTCKAIQEDGEKLLIILKPLVEQSDRAFSRILLSIRWLFEKSKFAYHRELLSSLKSTLQLLVSVIVMETVSDRDLLTHLVEEVVNLKHVVQSGMYYMEHHLRSSQLMEASQPRTLVLPNVRSNTDLLAIEGTVNAETDGALNDDSKTADAGETPSSSTLTVQAEDWDQDSFQCAVEEVTSPIADQVGPLALLPYFRAYLAQEKICQYTDKALELRDRDQDGNPVHVQTELRRTASSNTPSLSRQNNAVPLDTSSEPTSDTTPTMDHTQSPFDTPQSDFSGSLSINTGLGSDHQPETIRISESDPASLHVTQVLTGDAKNPQLKNSDYGSSSGLERNVSDSDSTSILNGAHDLSHNIGTAKQELERNILRKPVPIPEDIPSTGPGVSNSTSAPSELPSPQDVVDPDVLCLITHTGDEREMPFRKCRTYHDLVASVKEQVLRSWTASPYWSAEIQESIERMYQVSLKPIDHSLKYKVQCFLYYQTMFEYKFQPVRVDDWEQTVRPGQNIKILFDRKDLKQLFDSYDSGDLVIESENARDSYDRLLRGEAEEIQSKPVLRIREARTSDGTQPAPTPSQRPKVKPKKNIFGPLLGTTRR